MNFLLERQSATDTSMESELFKDGQFFCYCLERPEEGLPGTAALPVVAIPAGIYDIELVHSPHFNRILPHIMNVPGRTAILMHGGNEAKDSLGCILCGYSEKGPDWIGDASAVNDLVRIMQAAKSNGEDLKIQVLDP